MPSISITKGKGSFNHNMRKFHTPNVDKERTKLNVVLKEFCIEQTYHDLFDQALLQYNQKQKRADRKIEDYYRHILHSKKEKAFHELVVQVGNMNDNQQDFNSILEEYYKGFEERNPQMRVVAAVIHNDEKTPHLHLDYVPFITGQKRGLGTKVANNRAIEQMGYESFDDWRISEMNALESILHEYGLNRTIMNNTDRHRSVSGYKREQRLIEERIKQLDRQEQTSPVEVKTNVFGMETVKKRDFDLIDEKNKLLEAELSVLRAENQKHEQNLLEMKKKPYVVLNESLRRDNEELERDNQEAFDFLTNMDNEYVSIEKFQTLEMKYKQSVQYKAKYEEIKKENEQLKSKYEPEAPKSIREQIAMAQKIKQKKSYEDLEQENRKLKQDVEFWKSKFFDIVEDLEVFFGKIKEAFGYFMNKDDVDQLLEESIEDSFRDTGTVFESLDKSKSSSIDLER